MGFLSRPLDLTANFIGNTEDKAYHRKAISKIQNMENSTGQIIHFLQQIAGEKGKRYITFFRL